MAAAYVPLDTHTHKPDTIITGFNWENPSSPDDPIAAYLFERKEIILKFIFLTAHHTGSMIFGVRRVVSNNVTLYILKVCVCVSQTAHSVFRLRVYGRMGLNGEFKLLSFVSTSEVYTFKDNYFCFL